MKGKGWEFSRNKGGYSSRVGEKLRIRVEVVIIVNGEWMEFFEDFGVWRKRLSSIS